MVCLLLADIAANRCYERAIAPRLPMSEEQLKAFLEKVRGDTSLQEKLKAAADADAITAIATEVGFAITAEDIQLMQSATVELSDEELEEVAGGGGCHGCSGCPIYYATSTGG